VNVGGEDSEKREHVRNSLRGDVAGSVVQAGNIYGDIRLDLGDRDQPIPRQLPADIPDFVGRSAELRTLDRLAAGMGRNAAVSAVIGSGGVGKTALAVHWGHRTAHAFPDGQLYLNLRGFSPDAYPMTTEEALRGMLEVVHGPRIPTSVDAQVGLFRSILADRRILLVLDNARDFDQIQSLLPGGHTSFALVTSRSRLEGVAITHGGRIIALDAFDDTVALRYFKRTVGAKRVTEQPRAAEEILNYCGGLPLALSVISARARNLPGFPLSALSAQLRDEVDRLGALDSGEMATSIRSVFATSYQNLSPAAARLFRLIGMHPGPDITPAAAASLAALPARDVLAPLRELCRAHLMAEHLPSRFVIHDLLRIYAAELSADADDEAGRSAALARMFDFYVHSAYAAERLMNPQRPDIELREHATDVIPAEPQTYAEAVAWCSAEYAVLLSAVRQASTRGHHGRAWQLAWSLGCFFQRSGRFRDWERTYTAGFAAAGHLGDEYAIATMKLGLGDACARLGEHDDANGHLRDALSLFRDGGHGVSEGRTHLTLAWLCEQRRRYTEALEHSHAALALYRAAEYRAGEPRALNWVGWSCALLGSFHEAVSYCEEALLITQELGDQDGESSTLDSLGFAHHELHDHERAMDYYQRAVDLRQRLGARFGEASSLERLGDVCKSSGDVPAALSCWTKALSILTDIRHPRGAGLAKKIDEVSGRTHG
jgi:tetratricopeptide (TPR) repeat protein